MLADYRSALAEALISLRMASEMEDERGEGEALAVVALVQWSLGDYELALEHAYRGLRMAERVQDQAGLAWFYTIIGGVHQSLGDYQKSLEYHQKSHLLFSQQQYGLGEARSLSGLGAVHLALGDTEAALACHEKALGMYRRIGNPLGEARALNDIGEIHHAHGEFDTAVELHRRSLAIRERQKSQQSEVTSLLNLGKAYLALQQIEEARQALTKALAISGKIGVKPKESRAHELLSTLCEQAGDLAMALRHYRLFHQLREEIFSEEENTKVKNLQIGIEVERSEREAEIHRLRNVELKEKNEELARVLRELQGTQAQLVQSEKMAALGDLMAAIVHEINTPLGAIQTSADISARAADKIVKAIESSKTIEDLTGSVRGTVSALRTNGQSITDAGKRISRMIASMKSFARLDQASFQSFHLNESVEDSLAVLAPRLAKEITVVKELADLPPIYGYPAEINQVVMNLLRNAGEAIPGEGEIRIRTFQENGFQCIDITDTGRGIPAGHLDRLFNPGFTVHDARVKASMSLFTSLNIVQKHQGEIRVQSEVDKGSTFIIRLKGLDPAEKSATGSPEERGLR